MRPFRVPLFTLLLTCVGACTQLSPHTAIQHSVVKVAILHIHVHGAFFPKTSTTKIPENFGFLKMLKLHRAFGLQPLVVRIGSFNACLQDAQSVIRPQAIGSGVLFCDAYTQRTQADFSVVHAGGLRACLTALDISYENTLLVHFLDHTVAGLQLSASEVMQYLRTVVRFVLGASGFAHFADEKMQIRSGQIQSVTINRKALNPGKIYRMSIHNVIAASGNGYSRLWERSSDNNTGFWDAEVMSTYFTELTPLAISDFRPGQTVRRK